MSAILPTYTPKSRPLARSAPSQSGFASSFLSKKPHARYSNEGAAASWPGFLRRRARTTNLAVLLLAVTAVFSLLANVRMFFNDSVFRVVKLPSRVPLTLSKTASNYQQLSHLVLVPCHAVYIGHDPAQSHNDDQWVLQEVQKGGSVDTFAKHIVKGVEITAQDPQALLVFSGGMTRNAAQQTEAQSYLRYIEARELFQQYSPGSANPFPRATTEIFAMDSYQNLIFGLARFKEVTEQWPTAITVIGFGMKQRRFEEIHRAAIRWPKSAFTYIGIDHEDAANQNYEGELKYGLQPFLEDTYGCKGSLLAKRRSRNPYNRFHPYFTSTPEIGALLDYCPSEPTRIYEGALPWD